MKRVLVVLLALVMGAGLLFAEAKWGLTMSGTYVFWDQDGNAGFSALQDTSYTITGADGDLSYTATTEPDGDAFMGDSGTIVLRNIQGAYTLFDKMLKVTVGKDRISDYRATTFIQGANAYTRFANAEWGLALQAYPVTGLSAGVFVRFPTAPAVADYADNLGFGASYALENIGTFNVVFRTMDSAPMVNEFGFSANVTAVEILPIVVGYGVKLNDPGDPAHTIYFSTKYGVTDAINVLLDVKLAYQTEFQYAAELQATYALNKSWTAGVDLYYGSEAFDYGDMVDGGFAIAPWVKLLVGGNQWLKPGFYLDTDGDGAGADELLWKIKLYYEINL